MKVISLIERAAVGRAITDKGAGRATPLFAYVRPRRIEGVPGPEDVVIDQQFGIAYVSSQVRGVGSARHVNGDIFRIDLTADNPRPLSMIGSLEERVGFFHPHGLDLFVGKDGKRRLFVINHRSEDTHSIDIFDVERDGRLSYFRRVSDDKELTSPNDLVALTDDSFLVVNDHGYRTQLAKSIEDLMRICLRLGFGRVVRGQLTTEGAKWETIADGIGMSGGIEVDDRHSPRRLYVSSASGNRILLFRREGEAWARAGAISLDGAPDNLSWDREGRLWVAAHSNPLALLLYMVGWRKAAPSLVLRIREPDGPGPAVECMFLDNGDTLSAASVAALYSGPQRSRLLVGAVAGRHLLLFDLPPKT